MPILRVLQELENEEDGNAWGTDIEVLAERLGMDANQIGQQLDSLEYDGYISVKDNAQTFGNPNGHYGVKLLPEGRRELGEWPADPMTALAVALARALEEASDMSGIPDEQSRLRSLAKQLREAGPGIAVTLILEGAKLLGGS